MTANKTPLPIRQISPSDGYFFHGYYDIQPWSACGSYFLCLQTAFWNRPPEANDFAALGMIDLDTGEFIRLEDTTAWNFQQGTMAHWLGTADGHRIIFNHRGDDRFESVVLDVHSGKRRMLPQAVAAVSHSGETALGLNFARLAVTRPGYGYAGLPDPFADEPFPEKDGIWLLRLETGERRLLVSTAQIAAEHWHSGMKGARMWFNHVLYNEDDTRFAFLVRFAPPGRRHEHTAMFTANLDGSDLCRLIDYSLVSHYDWYGAGRILAWAGIPDRDRQHFFLIDDRAKQSEIVGRDILTEDGHCSFSPDGKWILNDTYPDVEARRALMLFNPDTEKRIDLGRFLSPPPPLNELRCDLHPCWNRAGTQISFDSTHEGWRAVYVADIADLLAR